MELIKELEEIKFKNVKPQSLIEQIEAQREELAKKIHILNIYSIVKELREANDSGLFEEAKINYIQIVKRYDCDVDFTYFLIGFYDEKNNVVRHKNKTLEDIKESFVNLIVNDKNKDFLGKDLVDLSHIKIKVEKNFEDLLDSFLSQELKSALQYSEMHSILNKNKDSVSKKCKL